MKYNLNSATGKADLKFFWPFLREEKLPMFIATIGILLSSGLNLWAPYIMGHAIDTYVMVGDLASLWLVAGQLVLIYLGAFAASYIQTNVMGAVGQRLLLRLRNAIFKKIGELPVAFFNENKAGDLISRINNDTDKLNQFFSQAIMQFVGNAFMIVGAAFSLLSIHTKLGVVALVPALVLLFVTRVTAALIKRQNAQSLKATGSFSGAVQESLENFKVMIAFSRRDYFRSHLAASNDDNYRAATRAGIANTSLMPFYGLMGNAAQLLVIIYGLSLIAAGQFTIGLLVSMLTYVNRTYDPLRQVASFWASMQSALAAGDRVHKILNLSSNLASLSPSAPTLELHPIIEFKNVSFGYPEGRRVLENVNLKFAAGKTYALVGPTGGGKTTTASLMARLYDPTAGEVLLDGADIRTYSDADRVAKIGFILQEAFLFRGTVRANITYGNDKYASLSDADLLAHLESIGLATLLTRFEKGLESEIGAGGGSLSSGQRQIIAFMRAILREPELLILDEATANIDTVTEQLLEAALEALPKSTARVIIAHRLNTIENADEIFFVSGGSVTPAGSLREAIDMLMHKERRS